MLSNILCFFGFHRWFEVRSEHFMCYKCWITKHSRDFVEGGMF